MEIGVRVEAEDLRSGEVKHIASAYLTFVSLNAHGRPTPVAPYTPTTEEGIRRAREAMHRKECHLQIQSKTLTQDDKRS
jgi:acyl-CoA hydrolase